MKAGSGLVGIILTAIVIPFIAYLWKARAESRRRRHDAILKANERFRFAFTAAIEALYSTQQNLHAIISGSRGHHEAEIIEFRRLPPSGSLAKFDQATKRYRALCDSNAPVMLPNYPHNAEGQPMREDRLARTELLAAINKLLDFAPSR